MSSSRLTDVSGETRHLVQDVDVVDDQHVAWSEYHYTAAFLQVLVPSSDPCVPDGAITAECCIKGGMRIAMEEFFRSLCGLTVCFLDRVRLATRPFSVECDLF